MSNNDTLVLNTIAHSNPTTEKMFTHFALKERHRQPYSVVRSLRNLRAHGEELDEAAIAKMFTELEKAGFGKAKRKKGRITHFNFNYPAYQLGRAVLEGKSLAEVKQEPKKLTLNTAPVAKQVAAKAPAVKAPLQSASTTSKTVIYCHGINGRPMKVEVEGEVTSAQVDLMLKNFQSVGSA